VGLSIRRRLTLWNAVAFAIVLVGFAGLVYVLVAQAVRQQAARAAQATLRLMQTDPRLSAEPNERARYWVNEFEEHMGVLAGVYQPDGSPIAVHPDLAAHFAGPPPPPSTQAVPTDPAGDRWFVASRPAQAGGQELRVLLLVPLRDGDAELAMLARVLAAAAPLAFLLSAAVAYLLARKALAPVDALRRSADAITVNRLSDRLPVTNPGDELGRLATTVNAMVGRLERSFGEIRRFTADASHELRTPLTAIRMEAEAVLDRAATVAECKALAGSILEECGRLARLTDQLLALAREDAGIADSELERVDLGELVGGVADALRAVAEAKQVTMTADLHAGAIVTGDAIRLRQLAMNLIDNAIKYTQEGGSVQVAVASTDPGVVLVVADTGVGIPAEHLPRVFDRFYRVDRARSRELGGTGLGLSIAQSIVKGHGGSIELTSRPGSGSTATVVLPVNGQRTSR
jgi:heavy metal sensor kinase